MWNAIQPHPDFATPQGLSIEVAAIRSEDGTLVLRYALTGSTSGLAIPPEEATQRADELWRHSCFEAFVCVPPHSAYREFNLAPSTRWAAYRFDDYRTGMTGTDDRPTRIMTRRSANSFDLFATLDLSDLPDAPWQLALSAVIEDKDGRLSYWALAHPPGKPDFHHVDGFTLTLTGPDS